MGQKHGALPAVQLDHRFPELDSLRGVAAGAVVLVHFTNALAPGVHPLLAALAVVVGGGHAAVLLFFLLSGFVLSTPYLRDRAPGYGSFVLKRVCRVYLPYAAAILLAAGLAGQMYSRAPTGNVWVDATWIEPFSWRLLLQHLVLIGPLDQNKLNTAIWTLAVEMRVALVFPLVVLLARRLRPVLVPVLALAVLGVVVPGERHWPGNFWDTVFYTQFFVYGAMLRMYLPGLRERLLGLGQARVAAVTAVAFLCYSLGHHLRIGPHGNGAGRLNDWLMGSAASVLMVVAIAWNPVRRLLHGRVLLWLGSRSYSLYLLHATVLFAMIRLQPGSVLRAGEFPVFVAVSLLAAEVFYRGVEVPSLLLARGVGSGRRGAAQVPAEILPPST